MDFSVKTIEKHIYSQLENFYLVPFDFSSLRAAGVMRRWQVGVENEELSV